MSLKASRTLYNLTGKIDNALNSTREFIQEVKDQG